VLSLIGLNNTPNKGQVSRSSILSFSRNSCRWRCQNATQSAVFAITAKRVSAIYQILLSLCSLHKKYVWQLLLLFWFSLYRVEFNRLV